MSTQIKVQFRDRTGEKANSTFHMAGTVDPSTLTALADALDGISDSGITTFDAAYETNTVVGTAASGPYADASDKLVLEFLSTTGNLQKYEIPAPDENDFNADEESVDLAVIQPFIDAVTTYCVDTNGNALTYKRGYRARTHRKS